MQPATSDTATTIAVARYRFSFRMLAPLALPTFAGSLLRGQFGAALRRVSCMTGEKDCTPCPLRVTCPYPAIFEHPAPGTHGHLKVTQAPNPYVVEPPPLHTPSLAAGDTLQFCIVLIGRAIDQLPLISFALQRALQTGIGRERANGELIEIAWQDTSNPAPAADPADPANPADPPQYTFTPIWLAGNAAIAPHAPRINMTPPLHSTEAITLQLHTPMRLQHQGSPVQAHQLTPRKLVADLLRRITLLAEFHADQHDLIPNAPDLVRHAEALEHHPSLRWQDWSRYSSRQQQRMTLGGALGEWQLRGELSPLLPWLQLGQWLHVGKNATMGMGHYTLQTGNT